MRNRTLADLAREYEETAKTLEKQLTQIDIDLKKHPCGSENVRLCQKRLIVEEMHLEAKIAARQLKHYYDK